MANISNSADTGTFITLPEAAVFLCIAKSTLYKHTSAGNISHFKPNGKLILFKKEDLIAWMEKNRIPSNDELKANNIVEPQKARIC